MSLLQSFIQRVERFLDRYNMAPTRFGRDAASDPNFVSDLRNGRKPNPDLIESVERWMKDYSAETRGKAVPSKRARPNGREARAA